MLCLNLKWLTILAEREGVGLKAEQLTIRASTCQQHTRSYLEHLILCGQLTQEHAQESNYDYEVPS